MKLVFTLVLLFVASLFALPHSTAAKTGAQEKPPQWPLFRKHQLDAGANESAAVADLNHDGRLDIVSGENWYAAPDWKKHRLREINFQNGYVDNFSDMILDVNGDGFPDVVGCAWFSKQMRWFQNPGRFDGELANVLWKENVVETGFNYELAMQVDIDGDGKALEILPNYGSSPEIAWWEVVKGQFVRHVVGKVPVPRGGMHGTGVGDVNGDGKPDVLTAHGWFAAPTDARTGNWMWNEFPASAKVPRQCGHMYAQDINGDGKNDIVTGHGHDFGVFWLENKGNNWVKHAIDDSWSQAHAMTNVDLDGDGKRDLVTGKRYLAHDIDPGAYEPLGLYWYRLNADATYTKHVIDFGGKVGGGMQLPVIDVDGDGDLDIVAPGKSGLYLFEQINPARQKAK
ncbi:MAG: VCBS repeat-containing protein [Acidobacteria bacterium]|nr:VCBS repeat-containing protein [Acidobacteriota bacterium]